MQFYRLLNAAVAFVNAFRPGLVASAGVPDGWSMSDRFEGFRFELVPAFSHGVNVKTAIRDKADSLFCFGWVQDSPKKTIVGEARCRKSGAAGQEMKRLLTTLAEEVPAKSDAEGDTIGVRSNQIVVRDYPDSKIRLHFSTFKILSPGRNTCFRDEPHKCGHLYDEGEDGTPFRNR